ncbi:class F sortase [Curtobacterium sp. TXMA1]|uniref:class F sortase n=1 Tax=Curtobacterium sp. TXMA1 TaxID=2876939 RepID=UPI001CCD6D26|nr:class F sortase [Curtobacterium sp. TXMA1]UBQ02734.1 class F sortase [Curtobacterium sp. TXMA1]
MTLAALVLAAGLVTTGVVGIVQQGQRPAAAPTLPDLRGNRVDAALGLAPSPAAVRRMEVQSVGGATFRVPGVGLEVPLRSLVTVDDEVQPPTFTDAFWIRDLGTSVRAPQAGTVFVAMHSLRGGGVGPGNALYDTATGAARVATGDAVEVAGVRYVVTGTRTVPKPSISGDATVWADVPGRLVVITCLERPDGGPSRENFVVEARLADGAAPTGTPGAATARTGAEGKSG